MIVVASGAEERTALTALGVPLDQVVLQSDFATAQQALDYAVRLARDWLSALSGVRVVLLETTARTLQGLLAQLKELLPSDWQAARPVTVDDAHTLLDLSV
jgi:hypothetical protein